ncbi:MAG: hypothetical protein JWO05_3253 [Gemmatimonadetes bacterium]|nr:hypothetical protein [Gemmatimonadota bacterium]
MSDAFIGGILHIFREICEGGKPGERTAIIDRTEADGTGNHGLLATLDRLSAEQASNPTALGLGAAAHAAHAAYYMEVTTLFARGEHPKMDWPRSFEPHTVSATEWAATRLRLRAAYEDVLALVGETRAWDERAAGGLAGNLAHAAYHLGALRQVVKLA